MRANDRWFWLDDDPEWKALSDRVNNRQAPRRKETSEQPLPLPSPVMLQNSPKKLKLSLDIPIPRFKLPKPSRKVYLVGSLVGLGFSIGLLSLVLYIKQSSTDKPGVLSDSAHKAGYQTLLPSGKTEETESGKLSYDPSRDVASFTDSVGHVQLTVSQQPLPESFKKDPDTSVEKLAREFGAIEVINEANPKTYLGIGAQGSQTAIFHKKGLLVFIQASSELDRENWAAYITQLF